jgi:hypothetical protein
MSQRESEKAPSTRRMILADECGEVNMGTVDVPGEESISFAELLWKLPLFDDLFLSMQGQNVMIVDLYLRDLERDLLRELIEIERTPFPAMLIVSALSQMWIFAVYELLRTWRQRVKDLKRDAQKPAVQLAGYSKLAGIYYRVNSPTYGRSLHTRRNWIVL